MTVDPLELTLRLVELDTRNPPGSEDRVIDLLESLLLGAGFQVRRHRFAAGRSNLVATSPGHDDGSGIAFTGHVDTVPLGTGSWSHNPFGEIDAEGRLYGRGACDMKGGVAAFVAAAVNTAREGLFQNAVHLVITAGEEQGCEGALAMARQKFGLPAVAGWIVAEPTGNRLALGHKGALFAKLAWSGRTAHSSMPHLGDNAIYRACAAALSIRDFDLVADAHPVLGPATRSVGLIGGGHAANAVPDSAWLIADFRTLPGQAHSWIIEKLGELVGENGSVEVIHDMQPIWTDADDPFVKHCERALVRSGGRLASQMGMPFFTDASVLTLIAPAPVVIVGPGDPSLAHCIDEWCSCDEITQSMEIYSDLMRKAAHP